MRYTCKHCNNSFDGLTPQQFGGHVATCKKNPNSKNIKIKTKQVRKSKISKFTVNCHICKKEFDINEYNTNKPKKEKYFCSRSCANTRKHTIETKNKISKTLTREKIKICKYCGQKECIDSNICKKYKLVPSLIRYFNFDKKVIGTINFYHEFKRIEKLLYKDYHKNNLSIPELMKKYNHYDYRNFNKILNSLGICKRNLSDARSISLIEGRGCLGTPHNYKHGWHKTWDRKNIFYRSSYELDFAIELDKKQILYEVESIRIKYWDSVKFKYRTAIPDFYLPKTNELVEIKSSYTYNKQNMKDKFKEYQKQNYKTKLILDKKEKHIKI